MDEQSIPAWTQAIVDAIDRNTAAIVDLGKRSTTVRGEAWPRPLMPPDWNPPCSMTGDGS